MFVNSSCCVKSQLVFVCVFILWLYVLVIHCLVATIILLDETNDAVMRALCCMLQQKKNPAEARWNGFMCSASLVYVDCLVRSRFRNLKKALTINIWRTSWSDSLFCGKHFITARFIDVFQLAFNFVNRATEIYSFLDSVQRARYSQVNFRHKK